MDDLTFTLRTLCLRNRDGSHATQADPLRATAFKGKHVDALIARWQAEGCLLARSGIVSQKVGKTSVIPADIPHVAKRFYAAAQVIARRGLRYGACQLCECASGAVELVRPTTMVSNRHNLQYH